jgi:hypothetical protein
MCICLKEHIYVQKYNILNLYNGHSHGVKQQYDSFSLDDIVDMNIIFWDRISKE